jgi:DNA-directed RNA polymerase subunit RPC12/RpoP
MEDEMMIKCPHCEGDVLINKKELNCGIFRHGIFKHNGEQIPPHAMKEDCDRWKMEELIYGCGKPFQIQNDKVIVCDYI